MGLYFFQDSNSTNNEILIYHPMESANLTDRNNQKIITIVSGLPRSGTTMMMRMLEAGGLETVVDGIRKADDDNPKGYYEYEKVKKLENGSTWLKGATGKVVKIISALLIHLPSSFQYQVIFMKRNMSEILASQSKMLERRGVVPGSVSDEILAKKFENHLAKTYTWLEKQDNIKTLYVNYNDFIDSPLEESRKIISFIEGISLDVGKMTEIVDLSLYRQRS